MATATARPNNCWRSCGATGRGTTARRGRSSSSCSRRRGWKTPGSRPSGVGFRRFSFPDRRCGMARVSIFPLPGALLLPGMELPLHIFEPRYKEIGRASCRERVCQYVYLSVHAVSLKKKEVKYKDNNIKKHK